MDFQTLQGRLLDYVVWRVRNGELTERGLAGMIGISQPHMHNILKGIRRLSPAVADRILATLEISVLDLAAQHQASLEGIRAVSALGLLTHTSPPEAARRGVSALPGPLPGRSPEPDGRSAPN